MRRAKEDTREPRRVRITRATVATPVGEATARVVDVDEVLELPADEADRLERTGKAVPDAGAATPSHVEDFDDEGLDEEPIDEEPVDDAGDEPAAPDPAADAPASGEGDAAPVSVEPAGVPGLIDTAAIEPVLERNTPARRPRGKK